MLHSTSFAAAWRTVTLSFAVTVFGLMQSEKYQTLPCIETGDPANPIMFFIHGWPDTCRVWEAQIEFFRARFRCIAVRLPGFEDRRVAGISFDQLATALRVTLLDKLSNSSHSKLILVCHDWGALFGYWLERNLPGKIEKLVSIDVGANFRMENWKQRVGITVYQWWLIKAYLIGKLIPPLGDWMTRFMVSLLKAPKRPMPAHSEMNYLYWYFWQSLFTTGRFAGIDGNYVPSCPLLFLFGTEKPFHLHSSNWIELIETQPGAQAIGIDSDHWVMVRKPEMTNRVIQQFIESNETGSIKPVRRA